MLAPINKIIDHSVVDGAGNRTAVFFQGCNFDCAYCHNPETINMCVNCLQCVEVCLVGALQAVGGAVQWNGELCVNCDSCIGVCPNSSSPKISHLTPEQVAQRISRNAPFIRGVTCSGGECTLYPAFLTELFRLTKAMGLENLLDSNGTYHYLEDEKLMDVTDGVMLDIKCFDNQMHQKLTGRRNELVLQNAVELAKVGKLTEIRTVIIPEMLPNEESVCQICALLAPYLSVAPIRYKLLRFRPMGVREEFQGWQTPSLSLMEELREIAMGYGFADVVIL